MAGATHAIEPSRGGHVVACVTVFVRTAAMRVQRAAQGRDGRLQRVVAGRRRRVAGVVIGRRGCAGRSRGAMTRKQRVHRRRIAGERVQDLVAARLDFARQHDFAFAREQRHRLHAAHVEGRADRSMRSCRVQSPSIARPSSSASRSTSTGAEPANSAKRGRLVEHGDADVGERGAHDVERVGAVAFGRQRVDEVGVGQITLFVGERQQLDDRIERRVRPGSGPWRSHVDGGVSRVPVWAGRSPLVSGRRLLANPVRAGQPDIVQVEGICANFNAGAADVPACGVPARPSGAGNKSNRSYRAEICRGRKLESGARLTATRGFCRSNR